MKHNTPFIKVLASVLCAIMLLGVIPLTTFATSTEEFQSETHTVFKHTEQTLAPGVTNYTNYAYASDGKQMVYYVTTADLTRDDVVAQVAYQNMQNDVYGMDKLSNMVACANAKYSDPANSQYISEYYNVVSACNGDGYNMSTGEPSGVFIMGGNVKKDWNKSGNPTFLAILNDGSAVIDNTQEAWNTCKEKGISEAIDVFGTTLVWDGKDITANVNGSYNTDRHSRTMVGITSDGKLVICVVDGRQEPFSCGASMHELAQIMLEAGCVRAFNLDGGGSTTFMAKNEGTDECTVINRPSDGAERAISNGIIIASTTKPSNVFERAILTAESDYVTPGSTVKFSATGVSPAGTSAQIPSEATVCLKDTSMGTISDGAFVSNGTAGDAVIQMIYNDKVVGETTVHVVIPDIAFTSSDITVPYGKTFALNVVGTTNGGLNSVTMKDGDVEFELSNSDMGTISGNNYTTCDESAGVTEGTITARCVWDESKTDTATVKFGKASEIVWDFEDGQLGSWWATTAYSDAGKYGRFEKASVAIVDETTGKVRNGKYALALTADFSGTTASGYKAVKFSLSTTNSINLEGATAFGMWMYLPTDANNLEFDFGSGKKIYEYYPAKDDKVDGEGWYFVRISKEYLASTLFKFTVYMTDPDETYANIFDKFTIYIDDLTVDYSDATDDREIPHFTNVTVSTGLDSFVAMNSQTINTNTFIVKATAQEDLSGNYTGLDITSAKVYIDGVQLNSDKYSCDNSGVITIPDVTLPNGTHTFRFEIFDNSGNMGFTTKQIVVNANNGDVAVVRRNASTIQPLAGSIEYFDVVAQNAENIEKITLKLDLDSLSAWELQGTDVLYGFDMSYSIDTRSNTASITLTKNDKATAVGETVIASLPVRVWQTTSYLNQEYIDAGRVNKSGAAEGASIWTPDVMWTTDRDRYVRIELNAESIVVTYTDKTTATFSQKQINVITEHNRYRSAGYYTTDGSYVTGDSTFVQQGKTSTHIHTVTDLEDKSATCTKSGYTGRTYCEVCESVVDWGTTIPATGHSYKSVDGVLKCDCGETFSGVYTDGKHYTNGLTTNGWIEESYYVNGVLTKGICLIDGLYYDFGDDGVCKDKATYNGLLTESGNLYYIALGVKKSGWYNDNENNYYFDKDTFAAVDGVQTIDGHKYKFVDCILKEGSLERTYSGYLTLYWAGRTYYNAWLEAQGKTYHFDAYGHLAQGLCVLSVSTGGEKYAFVFNEDTGVLERKITGNGLIHDEAGTVYLVNDVAQYSGLIKDGNDYYYINSYCKAVTGTYWVAKTNDLLPGGYYEFGENGKMLNPPAEKKNGISFESDGTYYYVDGHRTYAGLVKYGEDYYYFNSYCKAVTGTYWVAKTNDLLSGGYYAFDKNGKMLQGLVNEDGTLYYYVNGRKAYAGLIQIGEDYYYINSSCKAVTGTYWVSKTNDLLPGGYYAFDENGKMLQGLIDEDGTLYYYVNGRKAYAGLIQIGEDYYYINSSCKAVTGTYWVYKTNDLLPGGNREFAEDGKMIKS